MAQSPTAMQRTVLNTATKVLLKSVVVLGWTDQRTESKHFMTTRCSHMWS